MRGDKGFLDKDGRSPKEQAEWLQQGRRMQGKYLGFCLDSARWGSPQTVMYEMAPKDMIVFIQNWMEQNKGFERKLLHEKPIEELYKRFELPKTDNENCKENHETRKIVMPNGEVFCATQKEVKVFSPLELLASNHPYVRMQVLDFLDKDDSLAMALDIVEHEKGHDENDIYYEKDVHVANLASVIKNVAPDLMMIFRERSLEVRPGWESVFREQSAKLAQEVQHTDIKYCNALISDINTIYSFEKILRKLNLAPETKRLYCKNRFEEGCKISKDSYSCFGHDEPNNELVFDFDGWTLAYYVQRWMEQEKSPWFESDK